MKGSIRQRSPGTWELTIDAGRDPLGKCRRKYVTARGTKVQAQRKLRELLSSMDRGIDISTDKILFRDWLDRWMRDLIIPQRRQNTRERYQGIIRLHINPALGHVEVAKLSPYQVQAFESSLTVSGMAPEGVGLVHRVMSGAMRYAMRMEIVHRNTVSLVSPPTVAKRETEAPTVQEVRDTLSLAKSEKHHLLACIHLVAFTGVRRGEALGLTWDNVNLHAGQMRIIASLVKTRGQGLLLELPKTASGRRVIDLDTGTVDVLIDHSQEAPPRPSILRSFDTKTVHTTVPSRHTNGVSRRLKDEMAIADTILESAKLRDDADLNGAVRARKAVTPRSRKPTPLQTARWKAVQKAKRKGLSIRRIARELRIHRDTVRKYMNAESPPMARARATDDISP